MNQYFRLIVILSWLTIHSKQSVFTSVLIYRNKRRENQIKIILFYE